MAEQDVVELGAKDVVRVLVAAGVLVEPEAPRLALRSQRNDPPGFWTKPWRATSSSTPTCSRIGNVADSSDSPMW